MRSCLVAYVKDFKERRVRHICKKKGMPLKEIHEDVMETLGKEPPSYSTVKNEQQSLRG